MYEKGLRAFTLYTPYTREVDVGSLYTREIENSKKGASYACLFTQIHLSFPL